MTTASPVLSNGQTLVIVGAGLAGVRVAEGARGAGFAGPIVMIGDEVHPPYDRPPLSKAVLMSEGEERRIALLAPDALQALDLDLRLGRPVIALDRQGRRAVLAGGEAIAYDRLVLATGSSPRILPALNPGPRVSYLRGLDDALALRRALADARRVAIVGAGVIGLEVAAAAIAQGRRVSVIEIADRPMARSAARPVADFIARRHLSAGVDLRLGVRILHAAQGEDGVTLALSDGATLACDLVVVGVGVTPNDRLARDSGLEVAPGGVVADGHGRTSDEAVYAAGEVAVHFNSRHGRLDRQETWAHAAAHGEHVGRSLATCGGEPYAELASYWTDQYEFTLMVVGDPIGEADIVRGDPDAGKFLVFHLLGGRVAGVSAINSPRELRAAKRLVGAWPDPAALADPDADLAGLARAMEAP